MTLSRRALDAEEARCRFDELVATYVEVYGQARDSFYGEARYRKQLGSQMKAPGWRMILAEDRRAIAGYIFGFPLQSNTRWWRGVVTDLPEGFTIEWPGRTFAIAELLVRVPWRSRGIGRMLHDALLAERPEQRATLLVEPANSHASAAYHAWGWTRVGSLRPSWENAPLFDILVLSLGAAPRRLDD